MDVKINYRIAGKSSMRKLAEFTDRFAPTLFVRLEERLRAKRVYSVSFYGEDALIHGFLKRLNFEKGSDTTLSYLDIGGWRPIQGSNTYWLYRKRCYGTVVEPNPYFQRIWKSVRPKDQYIAAACSNIPNPELISFGKNASSNTLSEDFAAEISREQQILPTSKIKVKAHTLDELIKIHKRRFPGAYLLDIDIEGQDFEMLKTFSFEEELRPTLILIEASTNSLNHNSFSKVAKFLKNKNYLQVGTASITGLFFDISKGGDI